MVRADFLAEARDEAHLPPAGPPEIAIAGRSNVGKSTLLNRMAGRRGLARVSKTPGRTRGLVLFDVDLRLKEARRHLRLVDLPGYGYAHVSHGERRAWQAMVEGYVRKRATLRLVLVLVDARRPLGDEESQLLEWLHAMHVPCQVVVTKADKLGAAERGLLRQKLRAESSRLGASISLVSGETSEGMAALWSRIAQAVAEQKDDVTPGSG